MIELSVTPYTDELLKALRNQGMRINNFGFTPPKLPEDITEMDSTDLMSLFSLMTEYNTFLLMQIAFAKIDEERLNKVLEKAEAKYLIEAPKGETVAKTRAKILLDPEIEKLADAAAVAGHYRVLIENMQKGVEESTKVASREITRRNNNFNSNNRFTT